MNIQAQDHYRLSSPFSRQSIGGVSQSSTVASIYYLTNETEETDMFNSNNRQSNALEKFRIKAHLRSYVKDPININQSLLAEAAQQLKKLPYIDKDPSEIVAVELVMEAYRLGHFNYNDLTDDGYNLVSNIKYRGNLQISNHRIFSQQAPRNSYILKAI